MPAPDKDKRKQMGMPSSRTSALPQSLVQEQFTAANITPETAGLERGGLSYEGKAYQANKKTTWTDINNSVKVGMEAGKLYKQIQDKKAQDEREDLEIQLDNLERSGETPVYERAEQSIVDDEGNPVLDIDGNPTTETVGFEKARDEDGNVVMRSANTKQDAWKLLENFETKYGKQNSHWLADLKNQYFNGSESERFDQAVNDFDMIKDGMTLAEQKQYWNEIGKGFRESDQYKIEDQLLTIHENEVSSNQEKAQLAIGVDLLHNVYGPLLDKNATHDSVMEWIDGEERDVALAQENGSDIPSSMLTAVSSLKQAIISGNLDEEAIANWVSEEVDARFTALDGKFTGVSARHFSELKEGLTYNVLEALRAVGHTEDRLIHEREVAVANNYSGSARTGDDVNTAISLMTATIVDSPMSKLETEDKLISTALTAIASVNSHREDEDWQSAIDEAKKSHPGKFLDSKGQPIGDGDSIELRQRLAHHEMLNALKSFTEKIRENVDSPEARLLRKLGGKVWKEGGAIRVTLPSGLERKWANATLDMMDVAAVQYVQSVTKRLQEAEEGGDIEVIMGEALKYLSKEKRQEILSEIEDPETRATVEESLIGMSNGLAARLDGAIDTKVMELITLKIGESKDAATVQSEVLTEMASFLNELYDDESYPSYLLGILQKQHEDLRSTIKNTVESRFGLAETLSTTAATATRAANDLAKAQDRLLDGTKGVWQAVGGVNNPDSEDMQAFMVVEASSQGLTAGSQAVPPWFDEVAFNRFADPAKGFGRLAMTPKTIDDGKGNLVPNPEYDKALKDLIEVQGNNQKFYGYSEEEAIVNITNDAEALRVYLEGDKSQESMVELRRSLGKVSSLGFHTVVDDDGQIVFRPFVDLESSTVDFERNRWQMMSDIWRNDSRSQEHVLASGTEMGINIVDVLDSALADFIIEEHEMKRVRNALASFQGMAFAAQDAGGIGYQILHKITKARPESISATTLEPILAWSLTNTDTTQSLNDNPEQFMARVKQNGEDYIFMRTAIARQRGLGNPASDTSPAGKSVALAENYASTILTGLTQGLNTSQGVVAGMSGKIEYMGDDTWNAPFWTGYSPQAYTTFGRDTGDQTPSSVTLSLGMQFLFPESKVFAEEYKDEATMDRMERDDGTTDVFWKVDPKTGHLKEASDQADSSLLVSPTIWCDRIIPETQWQIAMSQDPSDPDSVNEVGVGLLREQGFSDQEIMEMWISDYVLPNLVSVEVFKDMVTTVDIFKSSGSTDHPFSGPDGVIKFLQALNHNREYGLIVPSTEGHDISMPLVTHRGEGIHYTRDLDDEFDNYPEIHTSGGQRVSNDRQLHTEHNSVTFNPYRAHYAQGALRLQPIGDDVAESSNPLQPAYGYDPPLKGTDEAKERKWGWAESMDPEWELPGIVGLDGKLSEYGFTVGNNPNNVNWGYYDAKGYMGAFVPLDATANSEQYNQTGVNLLTVSTESYLTKRNLGNPDETLAQRALDQDHWSMGSVIYMGLAREFQGLGGDEVDAAELESTIVSNLTAKGQSAWQAWKTLNNQRINDTSLAALKDKYGDDLSRVELVTLQSYDMLQVPNIEGWNTDGSTNTIPQIAAIMGFNRWMLESGLGGNREMNFWDESNTPLNIHQFTVTSDPRNFSLDHNPHRTEYDGYSSMDYTYKSGGKKISWSGNFSDRFIDTNYFGFPSTGQGRPATGTAKGYEPIKLSNQIPSSQGTPPAAPPLVIDPTEVEPTDYDTNDELLIGVETTAKINETTSIKLNWENIPADLSPEEGEQWVKDSRLNMKTSTEWKDMTQLEQLDWREERQGNRHGKMEWLSRDGEWKGHITTGWVGIRVKTPIEGGHLGTTMEYTHTVNPEGVQSPYSPKYIEIHSVVKGDTVYALAKANELTVAELLEANPDITAASEIKIGQEITIPDLSFDKIGIFVREKEGPFIANPRIIETKKKTNKKKYYTVGFGHYLDGSPGSRENFAKAFPKKSYKEFQLGKGTLNEGESLRLFDIDLESRIPNTIKLCVTDKEGKPFKVIKHKYEDFSLNLKKNLVSSTYRGAWGYSHKARELLAAGKFKEAAAEFKNSDEYRNAVRDGLPGVRTRMDGVAQAILDEEKRFKKNKETE